MGRLKQLAGDVGCTAAQLCLGWLLAKADHAVPIPGTTNIAHLDENLATLAIKWPEDLFAAADALFSIDAPSGPHYPCSAQKQIDTEVWANEPLD